MFAGSAVAEVPGQTAFQEEYLMPHITSQSWTQADIARLRQLSAEGASVTRAAAALNRKTTAVAKQCRAQGIALVGTRQAKAAIRALENQTQRR